MALTDEQAQEAAQRMRNSKYIPPSLQRQSSSSAGELPGSNPVSGVPTPLRPSTQLELDNVPHVPASAKCFRPNHGTYI